ncbi:MAG: septum site-determining protein MinC [Desulfobacterales bacterium]|nr:MAG: septum site-determining protein MinC [Desulfobacterales bacterium]
MANNPTFQEKIPVRVKGEGDSLRVTLEPGTPLPFIKEELNRRFEQMKHLAVNARVVIDAGEVEHAEEIVGELGRFLKDTFKVASVSPPARPAPAAAERTAPREAPPPWRYHRTDALVLAGRVRSGQKITARKHLVILGDVNPGGEVVAGGDIIVLGSLCGNASAGQPSHEEAIVLALDFRPIQIQIGGFVAAGSSDSPGKKIEFAHLEGGTILVEDYLQANPFGRLPWPQVR